MTKCSKMVWVERYFDGDTGLDAGEVEQHLQNCPRCSEYLAELHHLRDVIQQVSPPPKISDGQFPAYLEGVRERVDTARRHRWGIWIPLTVAAVLLLVAAPLMGTFFSHDAAPDTFVVSYSTELEGAEVYASQDEDGMATVWVDWSEVDG